tara:strand:+ start:924 stop:1547 length:624 start_codon:yes stop_codon:yes gene_type:complete
MARNKFVTLHESYMRRYERGGFLVGDVFKFNDDYKSTECYKSLGNNTKELIDDMINSGLHIRVTGIKDTEPARFPANAETSSLHVVLNLALDSGGGRYTHHVSVPGELGQAVQYAPNLLPIPDAMRRKDKVIIKPEEAEEDPNNIQNRTARGTTGTADHVGTPLSPTERSLPKQNTEIPCDPATPSPAAASYTLQYMSDLKKGPSMY